MTYREHRMLLDETSRIMNRMTGEVKEKFRHCIWYLIHYRGDTRKLGQAGHDFLSRKLICTPFEGCYGAHGWVVCVNGSPPRGLVIFQKSGDGVLVSFQAGPEETFILVSKAKIHAPVTKVMREFYSTYLEGRSEPVTLQ